MIELVRPTVDLADSWWEMVRAFGDAQIHGSSYRPADRALLGDPEAFEAWVDWLGLMEHPGSHVPEDFVPCSYRWIVDDGRVVGTIALRHELNDVLLQIAGHIGYAVEPGSRRRGVAGAALRQALELAARRGLDAVLLTCDVDNLASARTIESAGGVLEDAREGKRRYWVRTPRRVAALSLAALETPRLVLRLATLEEAADIREGRRRPDWAKGYPRQDDVDALARLAEVTPWSGRHIVRRSDGLVVGSVGCFGEPDADGMVEIGYGLVESARGTGLMTEVVAALSGAIEATGAGVMAHTEPDNVASQRVLARLGFRHVGEDDGELRWERQPHPEPALDATPRDARGVGTS
jgi:predicted acetyltransferase